MKKLFWIVIAILLTALIGLPYATGKLAENYYQNLLLLIAKNPSISIKNQSYERNWFSSNGELSVDINSITNPNPHKPLQSYTLQNKIFHGPLMWTNNGIKIGISYLASSIQFSSSPINITNKEESGNISILTGLNRRIYGDVFIPNFKALEGAKNEFISTQGVSGKFTSNLFADQLDFQLNSDELMIQSTVGYIKVNDINVQLNMDHYGKGIWLGEQTLKVNNILLKSDQKEESIEGISLTANLQPADNSLTANTELSINNYNRNINLSDLTLNANLSNINLKVPYLLNQLQRLWYHVHSPNKTLSSESLLREHSLKTLNAFLQPGLNLQASLNGEKNEGQVKASLSLNYQGLPSIEKITEANSLEEAFSAFNGDFDVYAAEDALKGTKFDKVGKHLKTFNFINSYKEGWQLKGELDQANLVINQHTMPITPLLRKWDKARQ